MGQHERFLDRVRNSSRAVFVVAYWLHRHGHTVMIPALRYAPTAADASAFADNGDFWIIENGERRRCEVKHLDSTNFTCDLDFPYPQVFIGSEASVDRARGQVQAYYVVSQDFRHVAIVPCDTREHWYVVTGRMRNTGNIERNYGCPRDRATFARLT